MTLYDELEVSPKATPEVIQAAYRSLVKRYHPDRNPGDAAAAERTRRVNDAYAVLSDPVKRAEYDAERAAARQRAAAPGGVSAGEAGAEREQAARREAERQAAEQQQWQRQQWERQEWERQHWERQQWERRGPVPAGSAVRSPIAIVGYVVGFVVSLWFVRAVLAELQSPRSSRSPTAPAYAPMGAQSSAAFVWREIDLGDLAVSLPGPPVEDSSIEQVPGGSSVIHSFHVTHGDNGEFDARTLDIRTPNGACNTPGAINGGVNGAIDGVRSTSGVADVRITKDEQVSLGGMPGREVLALVTPSKSGAERFAVKIVVYGRGCRVYQVMAAVTAALSHDAERVFASLRVTDAGIAAQRKAPVRSPPAARSTSRPEPDPSREK